MFVKLKDNKIISDFIQTQQYIILFYLDDDMFSSLDLRQVKTLNKVHALHIKIKLYNVVFD